MFIFGLIWFFGVSRLFGYAVFACVFPMGLKETSYTDKSFFVRPREEDLQMVEFKHLFRSQLLLAVGLHNGTQTNLYTQIIWICW